MTGISTSTRFLAIMLLWLAGAHANATQHLISPGQSVSRLVESIRPGDEVILMPGIHRPIDWEHVEGTAERRITIRSAMPQRTVVIDGDDFGIRFRNCRFITVQDVTIAGAREHGIIVTDDDDIDTVTGPVPADMVFRRMTVSRTGPIGETHGMYIAGVTDVRVEDSRIEGFGGCGIDIVGSRSIRVDRCTIAGLPEHAQHTGVRIRGGSRRVWIERSRFEGLGEQCLSIGGATPGYAFRPPLSTPDAADQGAHAVENAPPPAEAEQIVVERCELIAGDSSITFQHARRIAIHNCTIVNPRVWAFRLIHSEQPGATMKVQNTFITLGGNLIASEGDHSKRLVVVDHELGESDLVYEENLWWSPGLSGEMVAAMPGTQAFPQVSRVDPQLDDALRPLNRKAIGFGAISNGEVVVQEGTDD